MKIACKFTNRTDWFEIWYEDKKAMIATMYKNMAADLDVGYDPFGASIIRQRNEIAEYQKEIDDALDTFKTMDDTKINKWCFFDLIKRGTKPNEIRA